MPRTIALAARRNALGRIDRLVRDHFECGVGRAHNIAVSSLPGYSLPGDVSASKRYWVEDVIEPEVKITPQGTIRIPDTPGLGYHVRRELIERWTLEKEIWRAR